MIDKSQNPIEQLHELNQAVLVQLHQATGHVHAINAQIRKLASAALMPDTMLMSIVLYDGTSSPKSGLHSHVVIQAALSIPGGIGTVWWTSDEFDVHRNDPPDKQLLVRFIPFDSCDPGIKALLLPHVHPLLSLFFDNLGRLRRNLN